jgi:hypothetical protein
MPVSTRKDRKNEFDIYTYKGKSSLKPKLLKFLIWGSLTHRAEEPGAYRYRG